MQDLTPDLAQRKNRGDSLFSRKENRELYRLFRPTSLVLYRLFRATERELIIGSCPPFFRKKQVGGMQTAYEKGVFNQILMDLHETIRALLNPSAPSNLA